MAVITITLTEAEKVLISDSRKRLACLLLNMFELLLLSALRMSWIFVTGIQQKQNTTLTR